MLGNEIETFSMEIWIMHNIFLCRSCLYTFRYVGKQNIAIKMWVSFSLLPSLSPSLFSPPFIELILIIVVPLTYLLPLVRPAASDRVTTPSFSRSSPFGRPRLRPLGRRRSARSIQQVAVSYSAPLPHLSSWPGENPLDQLVHNMM